MSSSAKPPRLARAPDYRRVLGDTNRHKVLAHRAYKAALAARPLPSATCVEPAREPLAVAIEGGDDHDFKDCGFSHEAHILLNRVY
jgi:hypothetical protein